MPSGSLLAAAGPGAPKLAGEGGFTIVEMLVAMTIMLALTGAIFDVVNPVQATFQAQPEISDMHQRLRVAIDTLSKDVMMAGAGLPSTSVAPVMPYRAGATASDPAGGVFYRPDAITAVYVPWGGAAAVSHTYYVRNDPSSGIPQLMHYDGERTDAPLVDHVVTLEFEYFEQDGAQLHPTVFQDGPWTRDAPGLEPFDLDLLRICRVRARLRVEAALESMRGPAGTLFARAGTSTAMERYVPDQELQFDIAVRNIIRDR